MDDDDYYARKNARNTRDIDSLIALVRRCWAWLKRLGA